MQPNQYAWRLLDHVCNYLGEWYDYDPDSAKSKKKKMPESSDGVVHAAPPRALINELVSKLPKQCDYYTRVTTEEHVWAANEERREHEDPEEGRRAFHKITSERHSHLSEAILRISDFNMEGAIQLAERLRNADLLVTLTSDYLQRLNLEALAHPESKQKIQRKIEEVQDHAETYYDTFKDKWAFAHFKYRFEKHELGSMLKEVQEKAEKQSALTRFISKAKKMGQHVGKVGWINDVVGENDFAHAEKTLVQVATQEEEDLFNKKTQLCLAKLSMLAAEEEKTNGPPAFLPDNLAKYDNQLEIVDIQDRIGVHVGYFTSTAIDAKAAEELAVSTFSARIVAKYPGLKRLLKSAIFAILAREPLSVECLIDFLTLADPVMYDEEMEDEAEVLGQEFSLALKLVELSDLPNVNKIALRQVVWRRAMIRDDWSILNNSSGKSDEEVVSTLQQTAVFRTLIALGEDATQSLGVEGPAAVADKFNAQVSSPAEILAENNAFPVVLQRRFEGADKETEAVRKDLDREQALLKKYVDTAQLEVHFAGLVGDARGYVKQGWDQEGERNAEAAGV